MIAQVNDQGRLVAPRLGGDEDQAVDTAAALVPAPALVALQEQLAGAAQVAEELHRMAHSQGPRWTRERLRQLRTMTEHVRDVLTAAAPALTRHISAPGIEPSTGDVPRPGQHKEDIRG